jgi:hypothetical protein
MVKFGEFDQQPRLYESDSPDALCPSPIITFRSSGRVDTRANFKLFFIAIPTFTYQKED